MSKPIHVSPPPMCIFARYLSEQETSCWGMSITSSHDKPHADEWRHMAEMLFQERVSHAGRCSLCQSPAAVSNGTVKP